MNPLTLPAPLDQLWDDSLLPQISSEVSIEDPAILEQVLALAANSRALVRWLTADAVAQLADLGRFSAAVARLAASGPDGPGLAALAIHLRRHEQETPYLPPWRDDLAELIQTGRGLALDLALQAWIEGDAVPEWIDRVLLSVGDTEAWTKIAAVADHLPRAVLHYVADIGALCAPAPARRQLADAWAARRYSAGTTPDTHRWEAEARYWRWQESAAPEEAPLFLQVQAGLWLQDVGQSDRSQFLLGAARQRMPMDHVLRHHVLSDSETTQAPEEPAVVRLTLDRLERHIANPDDLLPMTLTAAALWHALPRVLTSLPQPTNARAWAEALALLVPIVEHILRDEPPAVDDPVAWVGEQVLARYRRETGSVSERPAVAAVTETLAASAGEVVLRVAVMLQQLHDHTAGDEPWPGADESSDDLTPPSASRIVRPGDDLWRPPPRGSR